MPSNLVLCGACGKFSKTGVVQPTVRRMPLIDRVNRTIKESGFSGGMAFPPIPAIDPALAAKVRIGVGVVILILAVPIPLISSLRGQGFATLWNTLAMVLVGIAFLLAPKLIRPDKEASAPTALPRTGAPSITLLGYDINLAVIQSLAVAVIIIASVRSSIWVAWWASIVGIALTPILLTTRARYPALLLGSVTSVNAIYLWSTWDFVFVMESAQAARLNSDFEIPLEPILWALAVVAAFPQLQLIKIGDFGIGRLRGDRHLRLFGSKTPFSPASALLISASYETLLILRYTPRTLPAMLGFG